jgi:uncharacterized protein HemX
MVVCLAVFLLALVAGLVILQQVSDSRHDNVRQLRQQVGQADATASVAESQVTNVQQRIAQTQNDLDELDTATTGTGNAARHLLRSGSSCGRWR